MVNENIGSVCDETEVDSDIENSKKYADDVAYDMFMGRESANQLKELKKIKDLQKIPNSILRPVAEYLAKQEFKSGKFDYIDPNFSKRE